MSSQPALGLLLLHALPLDSDMWAEQMSLLPHHTYAPNLYEFGDNIEHWAQRSLASAPEERLIVVGCSVGGSCALEVANLAPNRVAALVLIGTKARHDPDPALHQDALAYVKKQGVAGAWQEYWDPLFPEPNDRKFTPLAKRIALRQSAEHLMNGLSAFHTRPSRNDLVATSNVPIHVVCGEQDAYPRLNYSRELSESAKDGHLHVFEGSGHYLPIVKAQQLNALLRDVIRTQLGV